MLLFTSLLPSGPGGPPGPAYTVEGEGAVDTFAFSSINSDSVQSSRFIPGVSGKLVSCFFYARNTSEATLRFGIYSDVSTLPSALLAQTEAAADPIIGWREVSFDPADYVDVTSGVAFWLAQQVSAAVGTHHPISPVATHMRGRTVTYASGLPNPFNGTFNGVKRSLRYKIWTNP